MKALEAPVAMTDKQVTNAMKKRDRLLAEIKLMQEEADSIKAKLTAYLGGRDCIENDSFRLYNTEYTRPSVNTAALKADGLYDKHKRETVSHRFGYSYK